MTDINEETVIEGFEFDLLEDDDQVYVNMRDVDGGLITSCPAMHILEGYNMPDLPMNSDSDYINLELNNWVYKFEDRILARNKDLETKD